MNKTPTATYLNTIPDRSSDVGTREIMKKDAGNELIFAVVGHVGSGTSAIALQLKDVLEDSIIGTISIDVEIVKARTFLDQWAQDNNVVKPSKTGIELVRWYQNIGNKMRMESKDFSVIARMFALDVRRIRAEKTNQKISHNKPILPDGKPPGVHS